MALLMKVAALGFVGLIAVIAPAGAQPARLTHAASVHKSWESSSPVTGHLDAGATVTVTSHRAGYSHIESADVEKGWVYSRYLEEDGTPALSVPSAPTSTTTVGIDGLKDIAKLPKPKAVEANSSVC